MNHTIEDAKGKSQYTYAHNIDHNQGSYLNFGSYMDKILPTPNVPYVHYFGKVDGDANEILLYLNVLVTIDSTCMYL